MNEKSSSWRKGLSDWAWIGLILGVIYFFILPIISGSWERAIKKAQADFLINAPVVTNFAGDGQVIQPADQIATSLYSVVVMVYRDRSFVRGLATTNLVPGEKVWLRDLNLKDNPSAQEVHCFLVEPWTAVETNMIENTSGISTSATGRRIHSRPVS